MDWQQRMFQHQRLKTTLHFASGNEFSSTKQLRFLWKGWNQALLCLLLVAFTSSIGCNTLSLPAIDPTGNRIFSNNLTTLVNPHNPNNGYPSTQPAFQAPPPPPPCMQGKDGAPKKLCQGCLSGKGCLAKRKEAEDIRGRCGQLLLTPTSIVAPVGGEVILLAGICGKDEYLVTNEPIEWMLSPKSVGEFVEVGDDAKGQRRSFWKRDEGPKVEKLGVDFARGRTSREPGNITRGTSNPNDDLPIRKGQTWISITSPNEGISWVTALAPDSDVWDQRRQTATIYWEDASWEFPQPQFSTNGQNVRLVTRVWRASRDIGAEGWLVRYRVLNPDIARFMPTRSETAQVEVDRDGVAPVEIAIGQLQGMTIPHGSAAVEIEIIRPKRPLENIPELRLAVGSTVVTWSAPELQLNVGGPETAVPGQPLNYFATVANTGDVVAENVTVSVQFPPGMVLQSTNIKPSQETPESLTWDLGPLSPRNAFDVNVNLVARAVMDGQVTFRVNGAQNLQQIKPVRTLVQQPQVTMRLSPRQESSQVEVGGEAIFDVAVTNAGNQTINNLTITLQSDPGLQHVRDNLNSVASVIGFLNPGQSTTATGVFRVEREGELSVRATAQALGQTLASAQPVSIRALPARPKVPSLKLQISSDLRQQSIPVGGQFKAVWTIVNTGPVVLRSPVVLMQHTPNLKVLALSPGEPYQAERQLARWRLQDLQPGVNVALEGLFEGIAAGTQSGFTVTVDSDNITDKQSLVLDVGNAGPGGAGQPGGMGQPGGFGQPGGGAVMPPGSGQMNKPAITLGDADAPRLSVSIQPVSNAIRKGDVGTYEIRIENLANKPDQRVTLSILTPTGSVLKSIRAKELRYKLSNNDRQIDLEPIKYFRSNDSFSCVVQLKHDQVAAGELTASVTSLGQTSPVSKSLNIQVLD